MLLRYEFGSVKTTNHVFVDINGQEKTSSYKEISNKIKLTPLTLQVSSLKNPFPRTVWFAILLVEVFLYGCYPLFVKLSKVDNEIQYSTASAVLLIESGKLLFSLINIYPQWKEGEVDRQPLIVWLAFSIPAILYCFNNNVAILVQRYVDPASYVILNNLKIPTTAIVYRLVMKRSLTWMKWFAVCLLTIAGVLNSFGNLVSDEELRDHSNEIHVTITGLIIMAVYCAVSAFAGIWTELIVKKQYEVSIHQQNCMLYAFGVAFNLVAFLIVEKSSFAGVVTEGEPDSVWSKLKYFFHDYNLFVVLIVCSEICSGLIMSAVMKYASNITRLFIISSAILVTTLFSYIIFHFQINFSLLTSLVVVIVALILYNRI